MAEDFFPLLLLLSTRPTRFPGLHERRGRRGLIKVPTMPLDYTTKMTLVPPTLSDSTSALSPNGFPAPPVAAPSTLQGSLVGSDAVLELADGTAFRGISFGAEGKSIAGECVFQTGLSLQSPHAHCELNAVLQVWWDTPNHSQTPRMRVKS